jgi:hypothetical protein
MTTYTLAIADIMLLATVPDDAGIAGAVAKEVEDNGLDRHHGPIEYKAISGCTLTDDEPEDSDTIVWHSGNGGWIIDETGRDWRFAVRASA